MNTARSKICEPHAATTELTSSGIHAAFAVVIRAPRYHGHRDGISVCKELLDRLLDAADDGRTSEPHGLEFLPQPPPPIYYDNDPITLCRCNTTPMPPCGPCERGEVDADAH